MDGPIRLGHRMLSIQFKQDRHGQDRIELAYRRLETPAIAADDPQSSVQVALPLPLSTATLALETQG